MVMTSPQYSPRFLTLSSPKLRSHVCSSRRGESELSVAGSYAGQDVARYTVLVKPIDPLGRALEHPAGSGPGLYQRSLRLDPERPAADRVYGSAEMLGQRARDRTRIPIFDKPARTDRCSRVKTSPTRRSGTRQPRAKRCRPPSGVRSASCQQVALPTCLPEPWRQDGQ